jgi:hypothetical protein
MQRFLCLSLVAGLVLAGAAPVRADEQKDIRALLDKAVKASGGEEKLTKLIAGTTKFKGKMQFMGQELDIGGEFCLQLPDKLKVDISFEVMNMKIQVIQIFNGDKGWLSLNGTTMDLDKDMVAEGKDGLHAFRVQQLVPLLKDPKFKLKALGESKVGDRTAIGIQVSYEGMRDVNIFFDKEKSLLLKVDGRAKNMEGQEVNQETLYENYKEVDGLPYPAKLIVKQDNKPFIEMEVTEFKPVEKLDDSVFAKP